MKNKIHYFSKPLLVVFFQMGALLADSLAEVQRISTSTLACSSETLEKNSEMGKGDEGGRDGDLEAIRNWQLRPGVADSEEKREEEREGEDMAHDCHNEFNISACVGH